MKYSFLVINLIYIVFISLVETGNLIDLSSDGIPSNAPISTDPEHNYVNDTVIAANRDTRREPATVFDVFDMREYF